MERGSRDTGPVDYRQRDRHVWEGIFRQAPDAWRSASVSDLMGECAGFLRDRGATKVLDLGSGFGRWTNFVAKETGAFIVGLDYALGGCRLGRELRPPEARSLFAVGGITHLPFRDDAFDAFVAILILDNVERSHGIEAARELTRVLQPDSSGFVVLNPWPMPSASETSGNPTASCTRHDWTDDQALTELLGSWTVESSGRGEHELRWFRLG